MLLLQGKLRKRAQVKFKDDSEPRLKVWVEHESERDNGQTDLKLEELFLPVDQESILPPDESPVQVAVRAYPSGKGVAYAASKIVPMNTGSGRKSSE